MPWPSAQEYNEAISDPRGCFENEQLAGGAVSVGANGVPQPISGGFASIYRIRSGERNWAVKCFLRDVPDHMERYHAVQKALSTCALPYFTNFEYLNQGIKVNNVWYPVLKMDWEEGDTLDSYIFKQVTNQANMMFLARSFKELVGKLNRASIAHGDLQHGNIIVQGNRLRLLDYDTFFVQSLVGKGSNELGHPNYQHPRRAQSHFGTYLDNFSAWSIYTSLIALSIDSSLWSKLAGGDECLLFRASDYGDPLASYSFSMLEESGSAEIRNAARMLRSLCDKKPDEIPTLDEGLSQPVDLNPIRRISTVPAWIKNTSLTAEKDLELNRGASREAPALGSFRAYNEAVRWPQLSFEDYELTRGTCILEDTRVGRNGRVYHFRCPKRDVAVKCFLYEQEDRQSRLEQIGRALDHPSIKPFVSRMQYIERGIRVLDDWYPILKMDWFNGPTIHQMATGKVAVSDATASYLADRFAEMMKAFQSAGIAHGDLELANLIFVDNDLKVVDYDNFFVPAFARTRSPDLGHPGFQHPLRAALDFGPYTDNFSAWIIYTLLGYLGMKPKLFELIEPCLSDEKQTTTHRTHLRAMENDREPEVQRLGRLLRRLVAQQPSTIPALNADANFEDYLKGEPVRSEGASHNRTANNPFIKRRPRS